MRASLLTAETNNKEQAIAEWYLPSDVQSLITSLAYEYTPELSPVLYANNSRGIAAENDNYPAEEASLDIDALISFCPQCRSGLFPSANASDTNFLDSFIVWAQRHSRTRTACLSELAAHVSH